jgi:hypothetical protein
MNKHEACQAASLRWQGDEPNIVVLFIRWFAPQRARRSISLKPGQGPNFNLRSDTFKPAMQRLMANPSLKPFYPSLEVTVKPTPLSTPCINAQRGHTVCR